MSVDTMADGAGVPGAGRVHMLPTGAQDRMRAMRAERLARLRAGGPAQVVTLPAPQPPAPEPPRPEPEAEVALREFLRALLGDDAPQGGAGAVAELPGKQAEVDCELARLPGAGPGLIGALRRAGLTSLADVAGLEASELAARLGPIGRLVPAPAWVAAALAEATGAGCARPEQPRV